MSQYLLKNVHWRLIEPNPRKDGQPHPQGNVVHFTIYDSAGNKLPSHRRSPYEHVLTVRLHAPEVKDISGVDFDPSREFEVEPLRNISAQTFLRLLSLHKNFQKDRGSHRLNRS